MERGSHTAPQGAHRPTRAPRTPKEPTALVARSTRRRRPPRTAGASLGGGTLATSSGSLRFTQASGAYADSGRSSASWTLGSASLRSAGDSIGTGTGRRGRGGLRGHGDSRRRQASSAGASARASRARTGRRRRRPDTTGSLGSSVRGGTVPSLYDETGRATQQPQRYTFNLREALRAAEAHVNEELAAANAAAQHAVNMAAQRVAAEDALYAETQAMRATTEVGVTKFIRNIVDKSEALAELRAERAVLKLDVEEHIPYWMVRWAAFTKWLVSTAHTHGWRDEAKSIVKEMTDFFVSDDKESVVPEMREIVLNINAWRPSQFKRHMDAIREACHKLELQRPTAYTIAYKRLEECDERIKEAEAALADKVHASAAGTAIAKEASKTRKGEHSAAILETIAPPALNPVAPERSITSEIERFIFVAHNHVPPASMRKDFHEMLAFCAETGAWKDAFRVYGGMLQCRVLPNQVTYQSMIAACKHATPCNSAAAVAVLAEMRRRKHPVEATMFNRVIDACRLSGSWRRALTVFQAMVEAGCKPSTATYDALGGACALASVEDAPDVYAAMKYSGVPEFLAYTASVKAIHGNRAAKDRVGRKPKRQLGERLPRSRGAAEGAYQPLSETLSGSTRLGGTAQSFGAGHTSSFGATGAAPGVEPGEGKALEELHVSDARTTATPFGMRLMSQDALKRSHGGAASATSSSLVWQEGSLLGLGPLAKLPGPAS